MKTINTARMRKRALAAQPAVRRDRWGNPVTERMGWPCVVGADLVTVRLEAETGLNYAMRREQFDAMDDEEFASRLEYEVIRWQVNSA